VKLRAIHLIRHLERIERDLEELRKLDSALKEDRGYAARLRGSVQDESIRLEQIKTWLMQQVVRAPDEAPRDEVQVQLEAVSQPRPEIIIPGGTKIQGPARAVRSDKTAKTKKEPEKKKSFEFRYN